jgi:hypothetical protein
VGILFLFHTLSSQVREVNYKLKFNDKTNLFDCYLVIKKGNAQSPAERIQFNSQYTLVVPSGKKVKLAQNHMPLQNNRRYESKTPVLWSVTNMAISPEADTNHDYISIVPALAPTAYYNDLKEGDEVKLFSLSITPVINCGADVKIFQNGVDLHSGARGMGGGDYSNGFTMGGINQKYGGNASQVIPTLSVINDISFKSSKTGSAITTTFNQDANFGPFEYEWDGPSKFKAYTSSLKFDRLSDLKIGWYTLKVTDSRGCIQEKSIEVKPNDQLLNDETFVSPSAINPLNMRENHAIENISVYPNPATNYATLIITGQIGTKIAVNITDINGKMVQNNILKTVMEQGRLETNIDLLQYSPGIYNVNVDSDGLIKSQKLIVVK